MLKQTERKNNMSNESAKSLDQARNIIAKLDKESGNKKVSLNAEEHRLIRNLLRLEHIKYQEDYDRFSNVHTLAILSLIEDTRRKFKII